MRSYVWEKLKLIPRFTNDYTDLNSLSHPTSLGIGGKVLVLATQ